MNSGNIISNAYKILSFVFLIINKLVFPNRTCKISYLLMIMLAGKGISTAA
jgi:hypothetical protein